MFLADIYSNDHPGPSQRVKKTVQVETSKVLLKENGVNLTLTVVDTPGFGDAVDNSNCWQPVINYIESRFVSVQILLISFSLLRAALYSAVCVAALYVRGHILESSYSRFVLENPIIFSF